MGAGKTTIGKKLATRLGFTFYDLDEYIEKKEGISISEIFENEGERNFRDLEKNYLRELAEKDEVVISTGGGTPCFSENMKFMNASGMTVYLRMSPESLFSRLKNISSKRPLIADKSDDELLSFIREKLQERESFYMESKIVAEGLNAAVGSIAELIQNSGPQS